jgi:hypothetical protein
MLSSFPVSHPEDVELASHGGGKTLPGVIRQEGLLVLWQ